MNNSKRLCIVPCGTAKIWDKEPQAGPTQAQFVYTGVFATACQKYAKAFFKDWVILSAKQGFLFPEEIINETYNVSFIKPTNETITTKKLMDQAREKGLLDFYEIVVLGGRHYVNRTEAIFDQGQQIILPLSDCKGIGYMLQKLTRSIQESTEIDMNNYSKIYEGSCFKHKSSMVPEIKVGKYNTLYSFLRDTDDEEVELSFEQIEEVLGFSLPASAWKHRSWWANDISHTQAKAWLLAEWVIDTVEMSKKICLKKCKEY
jgi:hypothetical protein